MYVRTITYEDYEGQQRTEDFYFNLNKAELLKWMVTTGDYTIDKVLMRIVQERNGKRIMEAIDELIHLSYGQKSLDGRRFEKTDEIWKDFKETEAYATLFTELVTDAQKAGEFVNGIIPEKLANQISEEFKKNPQAIPAELKDYVDKK